MADNKLNIEIKVDKKELAQAKTELKKFTDELKLYSKAEIEQIKANSKIELQTKKDTAKQSLQETKTRSTKEIEILKSQLREEESLRKQSLSRREKEDNALIKRTQERQKSQSIFANPFNDPNVFRGQSVNLGSADALQQQIKYLLQYKSTLAGTDPQLQTTTRHINQLKMALSAIRSGGISRSDWEHYENLTTVFTGLSFALGLVAAGGLKALSIITALSKKAAELEVYSTKFVELAGNEKKATEQLNLLYTAASGNLTDTELIKYSNKMRLLNFTAEETAQILDIVERQSDAVGTSFQEGQSALQSFIVTGRGRALKELGISLVDVNAEVEKLTKETGKATDKLEEEEKEAIRLKAILNLYGDTLDNIAKKQKDSADKFQSMSTLWERFTTQIGGETLTIFNKAFNIFEKVNTSLNTMAVKTGIASDNTGTLGKSFAFVKDRALEFIIPFARIINMVDAYIDAIERLGNYFSEPQQGIDANGTKNVDRDLNPRYDSNYRKIAKRGIGGEFIPDKKTGGKAIQEITNDIKDLEKAILELQKKQNITDPNNTLFALYIKQIDELQAKLNFLSADISKTLNRPLGEGINLPKFDNTTPIEFQRGDGTTPMSRFQASLENRKTDSEEFNKLSSESNNVLSNVQNILEVLNVGTDTFVSKLITGFQSTLSVVNSVVSIIQSLTNIGNSGGIGNLFSSLFGIGLSFIPGAGAAGAVVGGISGGGGRTGASIGNLSLGNNGGNRSMPPIIITGTLDEQTFYAKNHKIYYQKKSKSFVS